MNSTGRTTVILVVILLIVIVAVGVGVALLVGQQRTTRKHLIPADYVGWVITRYGVEDAPPLPREEGYQVHEYGPDGRLETSDGRELGIALDEYYYRDGEELRRLSANPLGADGMIWHSYDGTTSFTNGDGVQKEIETTGFFVGTNEQFNERRGLQHMQIESITGAVPPPPPGQEDIE
jgi:hypothetical protein